jgi:hypothetical protein
MSKTAEMRSFRAAGVIGARKIVKFTSNRGEVALASAATDKLAGVADLGASEAGQIVDVAEGEYFEVVAGGAVAAGDMLTANADGAAVVAAAIAGQTVHVIGRAEVPAVAGDIFLAYLAPSVIVG